MCFWGYETMISDAKKIPEKSKERFHTFNPKGDQALSLTLRLMIAIESLRENRPHAGTKVRNFFKHGAISRFSRWHFGRLRHEKTSSIMVLTP